MYPHSSVASSPDQDCGSQSPNRRGDSFGKLRKRSFAVFDEIEAARRCSFPCSDIQVHNVGTLDQILALRPTYRTMPLLRACTISHGTCTLSRCKPLRPHFRGHPSSEPKRNTPTKNKKAKVIHIANHKFRQKSGNSRMVVNMAARTIAKPMDVTKVIFRKSRRSRSCGSLLCILAKRASVSPLPRAS